MVTTIGGCVPAGCLLPQGVQDPDGHRCSCLPPSQAARGMPCEQAHAISIGYEETFHEEAGPQVINKAKLLRAGKDNTFVKLVRLPAVLSFNRTCIGSLAAAL